MANKKGGKAVKVSIATGLAAAAAGAAYLYGTKDGAKKRKELGVFAKKAKVEMVKKLKKAKVLEKKIAKNLKTEWNQVKKVVKAKVAKRKK